ncbi:unnamed protein product [Linum trigynum]|uniref:Uncharacterized protein n=1 Tax=Linum trigynum TaxID=586398 RepID=A0AAV2DKS6_9ROSI
MGYSVGNLAVVVATVVVLGLSIAVGRSANLDVVSGPNCNGTVATDGKTVGYIAGALTELGAVTPVKGGGHNKNCKFPDGKSGSISGSASCRDGAALLEHRLPGEGGREAGGSM